MNHSLFTDFKLKLGFTSIALIVLAVSCKPKFDAPEAAGGNIDASRYVAVGSSMTAGFADGALYQEGQKNSFAAIIGEQLKAIGSGEFTAPYLPGSSAGIAIIPGNTVQVSAKFHLTYKTDCKNVSSLSPVRLAPTDNYAVFAANVSGTGPFRNMGVPDAKSFHIACAGYGDPANVASSYYNPFFQRMASSAGASVLSDALAQNPTFFTLSLGISDVLTYALNGGEYDSITNETRFDAAINQVVNQLCANGAKGLIVNIPDITQFPYFTTIPFNGLTLDQSQAASLNSIYNPIGFDTVFAQGNNAFMIRDAASPIGIRQIKEGERILLSTPLDSVKCYSMGSLLPMSQRYILSLDEIAAIRNAINAYNSRLLAIAQRKGLAYADAYSFFNRLNVGVVYNGVGVNTQFVKGGAFSLDGLNLNPIGHALLANECIKAINSTYGSSIAEVEASSYRGTVFP